VGVGPATRWIEHRDATADALGNVADRLDPTGADSARWTAVKAPSDLDATLMDCLDVAQSRGPTSVDEVRILVGWNDHLTSVGTHVKEADADLERVARASRPGAWLHWLAPTHRHYDRPAKAR
jgi:hypothetical protein